MTTSSTQLRATHGLAALFAEAGARARTSGRPVLVSAAERVAAIDPLDALESIGRAAGRDGSLAEYAAHRMYWAHPVDAFALAGVGAAAAFAPAGPDRFAMVDREWAALLDGALIDDPSGGAAGAGPVLMGGFAFDPDSPAAAHWRGFPSALLTLPRLQLAVVRGACWLTTTVLVSPDGEPDVDLAALDRLRAHLLGDAADRDGTAQTPRRGDVPPFGGATPTAEWRALVRRAVKAIRAGRMEKVVLARAVHARLTRDVDVTAVLRHLRSAYEDCYVFGCWRDDAAFVGASPERLVRLDGSDVRASSLAGSIRRGATPEEDAALGMTLMASAKDRAEHAMVRQALCDGLAELCEEVAAPEEPSLLTLPQVHHLHTPVRGRLRAGRSLLDVVARLHPTPAVGGVPRDAALRFIRDHEQLDRGWYAGPIGWVGRDRGELAVALRSALVRNRDAWLYAGCGIVVDSDPDHEYAESLLKLRPMELALSAACDAAPIAATRGPAR
jgi:isochorismate synthase